MVELTQDEIDCMKQLSSWSNCSSPPCKERTLQQLIQKKLVEQAHAIFLPIEHRQTGYRLTDFGSQTLRELKPNIR